MRPDTGHIAANGRRSSVAVPCHFGEWLQGRLGTAGPLALITLVPDALWLTAALQPSKRLKCQAVTHGNYPDATLRRFFRALDLPLRGQIKTRLPFSPGLGTGMSTATLVAAARLHGHSGAPQAVARATIAAEGASDPLMFRHPDRLLWASRLGQVLAHVPPPPRADLVGGFFGPARPTQARDQAYDDISDLVALWSGAKDLTTCAAVASESARRCLARRGPRADPTADLARDLGALGWATSHSGAARALIFAPGTAPQHAPAALREAGLRGIRQFGTGRA